MFLYSFFLIFEGSSLCSREFPSDVSSFMDTLDAFLLSCDSDILSIENFGKFEQYLLKNVSPASTNLIVMIHILAKTIYRRQPTLSYCNSFFLQENTLFQ